MRNRWNQMMSSFNSKEAYLIYGLAAGMTLTLVARRMQPTQIVVISDGIMGEIMAKSARVAI
jgi:hypothetical protein